MSFPRHEKHKDSGVEWLGEVPAHWDVVPIKRCGRLKGGAGFPHDEQGTQGEELHFHKVNSLSRAASDAKLQPGENTVSRETALRLGAFVFPPGTLVFAKVGAALLLGRICELGEAACIDNNMMGFVVDDAQCELGFVRYAMSLVRFDMIANPGAVPSLNEGQIGNFLLVRPARSEQAAIASFLDREARKIDALVEEQQRLIELLKEKRQAVISQAVTKGLDPNVPMKDSGVEWLGKVPAHWGVTRLKHATTLIIDCPHETPLYSDDGEFVVIRTADIADGQLDLSNAYKLDEPEYSRRVRRGTLCPSDIVYGREGERWGHAALVPDAPVCCLGQRMMQFRAGGEFSPAYLMWALNSESVYRQGQVDTVGATSPHVNVETIRNYVLAQPPHSEQAEIARVLSSACMKLDALVGQAEAAGLVLQERRAALISAAVTGKIDVRGLVPQPEAVAA